PLLQLWFARTVNRDPYFLYAASNAGSFVALLLYPLAIEPNLTLEQQSRCWAAGYGILALGMATCAAFVLRTSCVLATGNGPRLTNERSTIPPPNWQTRLRWLLLALVPASLLLSVTTYLTTDIAAIPLLWVIPLGVYLLTFVLTFAHRP